MSGYRRVSFYELCRLCTTNEGVKVPIFNEEGRNRQLPTKLQICLRLQVSEKDTLPKHICDLCLEKLEGYFDFRTSCVSAEVMLQSYSNALQNNDDFKRDGTVYIKDNQLNKVDLTKLNITSLQTPEVCTIKVPNTNNTSNGTVTNVNKIEESAAVHIISEGGTNTEIVGVANFDKITVEHNYSNKAKKPCQSTQLGLKGKVDLYTNTDERGIMNPEEVIVEEYTLSNDGSKLNNLSFSYENDRSLLSKDSLLMQKLVSENSTIDRSHLQECTQISEENKTNGSLPDQKSKSFYCITCLKTFKKKEQLNQHLKSHSDERPFKCRKCPRSFNRKEHLMRHVLSHTGQKEYVCDICCKTFSRKDNVRKHRKTHEPSGPFTCEFCGKEFVVKPYFIMHRKTHIANGEVSKDSSFQCEVCQRSFTRKDLLKRHLKRHQVGQLLNTLENMKTEEETMNSDENEAIYADKVTSSEYTAESILDQVVKQSS